MTKRSIAVTILCLTLWSAGCASRPDVVTLSKKRKIIVVPGAFDDLIQEGDEESD